MNFITGTGLKSVQLCPATIYVHSINTGFFLADSVSTWEKLCPGQSTIAFCITVEHAVQLTQSFNDKGIPAAAITASMSARARQVVLDDFDEGRILVLATVSVIDRSAMVGRATAAIMCRPTKSIDLYRSQMLTVLSAKPEKYYGDTHPEVSILDFSGNFSRFGVVI